ncbi:MAG: hypothetical protein KAT18_02070, partial [Candidatus Latescibacteria bacterium]|nr:hypothetical protein [Candidatus Latescibacterota bacterium]
MAVQLNDGKVLIVGWTTQIAELYDPTTETFTNADTTVYEHVQGATATLLQNGKVLLVGGTYDGAITAELYDPVTGQFTATDSLNYEHQYHSATLLQNGKVLIAGGRYVTPDSSHSKCELYDPATGTFTPTAGDLNIDRNGHAAVLLSDGKVLIAGGSRTTTPGSGIPLDSAELYDPASDSFTLTGNMAESRINHTATLLNDGTVLVTGRATGNTADIYDPSSGTFSATGNMSYDRRSHTAMRLPDGRVLIAGGVSGSGTLDTAELYDPSTGTFITAGSLSTARQQHTATLLPNGEVLIAGGHTGTTETSSAEHFTLAPSISIYQPTGIQSGNTKISFVIADPESSVVGLLVEGSDDDGVTWNNLSVTGDTTGITSANYDSSIVWLSGTDLPDQELWNGMLRITPHDRGSSGTADTTYIDLDNQVPQWVEAEGIEGDSTVTFWFNELVVDSTATNTSNITLSGGLTIASISVYESWTETTEKDSMTTAKGWAAGAVIDGEFYVIGGYTGSYLNTLLAYDPDTDSWTTKASMPTARRSPVAGVIDGKLYVAGGYKGSYLSTLEVYDPSTDSWTTKTPMTTAREDAAGGVINGRLYVAGGDNGTSVGLVESYDPATDSWTMQTSMPTLTYEGASGVIDGKLYVAGGWTTSLSNNLLVYDPATDSWSSKANMPTARRDAEAGVIGGKLYVAGGYGSSGYLDKLEVYDPASDNWTSKTSIPAPLRAPATGVIDNMLYAAGGHDGTSLRGILVVYDPQDCFDAELTSGQTLPSTTIPVTLSAFNIQDPYGNTATTLDKTFYPQEEGPSPFQPSIYMYQPDGRQSGNVTVAYEISDDDSSQVGLLVEYSTDGRTTWQAASVTSDTSDINFSNYESDLVWASGSDLNNQAVDDVQLRVTPYDSGGWGTADIVS